jgi:uncharacterized protein (TIGR01244 family)
MVRACTFVVAFVMALPGTLAAQPAAPIDRFQQVDDRLYRGAQPDRAGFEYLHRLGVRTVVNLRNDSDRRNADERRTVEALGMRYVHLPVRDGNFFTRGRTIPEDTIRTFFAILDEADDGPVFLHCRRGADRTGALVGFYRIARHQWDNPRAYAEAKALGMRSWYTGLKKQIYAFAAADTPTFSRQ